MLKRSLSLQEQKQHYNTNIQQTQELFFFKITQYALLQYVACAAKHKEQDSIIYPWVRTCGYR